MLASPWFLREDTAGRHNLSAGPEVMKQPYDERLMMTVRIHQTEPLQILLRVAAFMLGCLACPAQADSLREQLNAIRDAPLQDMERLTSTLAGNQQPEVTSILQALLDGKLVVRKTDQQVLIAEPVDDGYQLTDPVQKTPEKGLFARTDIRKINLNNTIRTQIRELLGRRALTDPEPSVRLGAVQALAQSHNPADMERLKARLARETDPGVEKAIRVGVALYDLSSPEPGVRLGAVKALGDYNSPEVVSRLTALTEQDESGRSVESDDSVRYAASRVLQGIRSRLQVFSGIETTFFGLSLGAVLVLSAIGLAITFGVMGVINMAHGELMMIGAYTTYVVQQLMPNHIDLSLCVAIPAAFVVAGLCGVAIERFVIRYLYGRPLETLLATFGVSLILQQSVRSIFSPLNKSVMTPSWMSGSWQFNEALSFTLNRFSVLLFSFFVFGLLLLVLKRSRLGLEVRAVAQNRSMARAMGIPTERVDALTFGLGSGIAGVAGVALSQLSNVGPNLGQSYIVDSFMVVVFGGVGNLWGTLVAGFSLGIANKLLEPYSGAVLAKILVLIFIILFIQKRPRGLFPQKGRAAEV